MPIMGKIVRNFSENLIMAGESKTMTTEKSKKKIDIFDENDGNYGYTRSEKN